MNCEIQILARSDSLEFGYDPTRSFIQNSDEGTNSCNCSAYEFPEAAFDCVCDFVKKYPGDNEYDCGFYNASQPRCNQCKLSED